MSDVLDFNDSLNDVTPMSPIPFPFEEKGKSELLMDVFRVFSFFCLHNPD